MTPPGQPENIAASVRARLLEASQRRNVEFQQILSEFAMERLRYETFKRRRTPFPDSEPLVLTRESLAAPERQTQWRAFLRRGRLEALPDTASLQRFSGNL